MQNIAAQLENADRFKRWVTVGQAFEKYLGGEATIQAQGLGRLDTELIWADKNAHRLADTDDPLPKAAWSDASYQFTLARLWVFGGYELIRCLDQAIENGPPEIKTCKREFARIRMPLAKYEAASAFRSSDFDVAMPIFHTEFGIGWSVANNVFITRRELADQLLELGTSGLPC